MAGSENERHREAKRERDGGHDLEIDQRLHANTPDLAQIARARDAVHHHAEDDGADDHRNKFQEGVAEHLETNGEIGRGDAERYAKRERGDDLREKRFI